MAFGGLAWTMGIAVESGPRSDGQTPKSCAHGDLVFLGEGGNAMYYRCRICGAGVIEQRGRLWVLAGIAK